MKKKERKHRRELTLIVALIVFVVLLITILLSALIVYIVLKTGIVAGVDELSMNATDLIIMLCIISLILGGCFSAIISELSLRPINSIISRMNRLASGDFHTRIEIAEPFLKFPAMQEVSDSFNRMAEELESTEVLRNDFVNNFSHEFKTPIVSMLGFAKLLKYENLSEEQKREYIDIIEKESQRLSTMATNVLNLTKYENQTILSDVKTYNLSEQIRSCILALEGKWNKKNININLDLEEYMISANEEMLHNVWINLLDNAIKFSPRNGDVDIEIQDCGANYKILIKNTAEDLTEKQQKRIFQKFYQADTSHSMEGNGIGLALVKKVIELHEGDISVDSKDGMVCFLVEINKCQGFSNNSM